MKRSEFMHSLEIFIADEAPFGSPAWPRLLVSGYLVVVRDVALSALSHSLDIGATRLGPAL
jgi:hypothetical protein